MKKTGAKLLGIMAVLAVLGGLALTTPGTVAAAPLVTIEYTAEVINVSDRGVELGGSVSIGDTITGSYTYDAGVPDSSTDPTVGIYPQTDPPFEFNVNAGILVTPVNTGGGRDRVFILDRPGDDRYIVDGGSRRSLPDRVGLQATRVRLDLFDFSGTALTSDALPTGALDLADFPDRSNLQINGCIGIEVFPGSFRCSSGRRGFTIRATLTSLRVVDVDTTPPTVVAELVPVDVDDDDEGLFRVEYSCSDTDDANPVITSATLNGIPVDNGQLVELEIDDDNESEFDEGILELEAPSFELVVTCVDESGNIGEASASPMFASDDDEDGDDEDGDEDDDDEDGDDSEDDEDD